MGQACQVCNHPKRLEIDREIVKGISHTKIGKEYNINNQTIRSHQEKHLSRQLTQAWEKKDLEESMDLLGRVDKILNRSEKIFHRNYDKGKDGIALKALDSSRQTIELLAKISYSLHQARVMELEMHREQSGEAQRESIQAFNEQCKIFSMAETDLFIGLLEKLYNQDSSIDVVADYRSDLDFHYTMERKASEGKYQDDFDITPTPSPEPKRKKVKRTRTDNNNHIRVKPEPSPRMKRGGSGPRRTRVI